MLPGLTVFLAFIFQEGVFVLVAGGLVWRLFTKDLPATSSPRTLAYFACVMAVLGFVLKAVPGHGFSR